MSELLKKTWTKLGLKTNPFKYYPQAGPARREGQAPITGAIGFGNPGAGTLPGTPATEEPALPPGNYLATESNNLLIAENGNNIILE